MKKFGTMIIKPDAMNVEDLNIIRKALIERDLFEDNLCLSLSQQIEYLNDKNM